MTGGQLSGGYALEKASASDNAVIDVPSDSTSDSPPPPARILHPHRVHGAGDVLHRVHGAGDGLPRVRGAGDVELAAGRQLRWRKSRQLIEDGIHDPAEDLQRAKLLEHPSSSLEVLPLDLTDAIEFVADNFDSLGEIRHIAMATLSTKVDVLDDTSLKHRFAGQAFQHMRLHIKIAAMEWLQDQVHIEDRKVPRLLLTGMPIVGEALESPFFVEDYHPAELSIHHLLAGSKPRRVALAKKALLFRPQDVECLRAALAKTLDEVDSGSMGPALTAEQVTDTHGPHWNAVRRFGLRQGLDASGAAKIRTIDDHSECDNNKAASRTQRIPMSSVATLMVMIKQLRLRLLHRGLDVPLAVGTEDMKSAYRQVPVSDSNLAFCVTMVVDPDHRTVQYHQLYGQPFGASHAVPNFYRVAEWLCRAARRYFHIALDHFFDDFFYVEPAATAESARKAITFLFDILGFKLDPVKAQPPSSSSTVLGVVFDLQHLQQDILFVRPKPERVRALSDEVESILRADWLPPSQVAKLIGKTDFINSTLFGRVGRAALAVLPHRQLQHARDWHLQPAVADALRWIQSLLQVAPSRQLTTKFRNIKPALLYTDGSAERLRDSSRVALNEVRSWGMTDNFMVGSVLWIPSRDIRLFTSATIPKSLVQEWVPKKQQIGQVELFGAVLGLLTFSHLLVDTEIIHFVDNDSATSALIRGYSGKLDSARLVGDYWLIAAKTRAHVFVDRVESKANPADGPSRGTFNWLLDRGFTFSAPPLHLLAANLTAHPASWFSDAVNLDLGVAGF